MDVLWLRKKLRYTQAEIAQWCGVTPGTVAAWERGRSTPSSSNIAKLRELATKIPRQSGIGALSKTASVGEVVDAFNSLPEADRYLVVDFVNRIIAKRQGQQGGDQGRFE